MSDPAITYLLPSDMPQSYIVKAEEPTDEKYGFAPDKRPIDFYIDCGIVNLDKPAGPTSHEVSAWVRKILHLTKAGHGGTLDPGVTGVLPVALGSATKVIGSLLSAGKEYVTLMYLHEQFELQKIQNVLKLFSTEIYQRPPIKSSVARRLRTRHIYYIQFMEMKDQFVLYRVGCEAGTYIRKLCFDLGEALLSGANMAELRRSRTGAFKEDETLCTLQDLHDAYTLWVDQKDERYLRCLISPMEKAVAHWKKIYIRDSAVDAIAHGASLAVAGVLNLEKSIAVQDPVAIMTQKGELVATGDAVMAADKIIDASHGFCVKTKRVYMQRGMYPTWKKQSDITTSN